MSGYMCTCDIPLWIGEKFVTLGLKCESPLNLKRTISICLDAAVINDIKVNPQLYMRLC